MTEELLKELAVMARRYTEIYNNFDYGFVSIDCDGTVPSVHLAYESFMNYAKTYDVEWYNERTRVCFFEYGIKVFALKPKAGKPDD